MDFCTWQIISLGLWDVKCHVSWYTGGMQTCKGNTVLAILRDVLGNTFFSFSTCFVFGNDGNVIIRGSVWGQSLSQNSCCFQRLCYRIPTSKMTSKSRATILEGSQFSNHGSIMETDGHHIRIIFGILVPNTNFFRHPVKQE